ncbi:MAG: hypothetical protein JO030_06580 [Candidatus Eremiobacteraeota bacterium]|nr:hypothetical protein [Candidatus Eremiobacteraeota bacterium]
MQTTLQLIRRPSPANRPFGLAMFEGNLWMGSWESERIYVMDPETLDLRLEIQAPGRPYGIAPIDGELRVVVAHGEEDDRYLYRVRGGAFDVASKTPCPDLTGSFMTARGSALYLGQMHHRRVLEMSPDYSIRREIALPTRSAGFAFGTDGRFYLISADDEFEHLRFGTLDPSNDHPQFDEMASMPEEARYLLHDGSQWWTSLRDANELATFTIAP